MAKRVFDIFVAAVLLVLFTPLMLAVGVLVKLSSPGPVLFKQDRIGYRGRPFVILKFRTMRDGSAKLYDVVHKGDPRITAIGKVLRSTHLDELPQLLNILRGDMSVVGPRPMSLDIAEMRARQIKRFDRRFDVPQGLTGLPQLFVRGEMKKGALSAHLLNMYYIRHQSFCFDCKILLRTIMTVLGRRGT